MGGRREELRGREGEEWGGHREEVRGREGEEWGDTGRS